MFRVLNDTRPPGGGGFRIPTVVVIGAGIAGLLAARVLHDHAASVIIIDHDSLDDAVRRGVPQGRQIHTLLPAGHQQLERWFPGITVEAEDAGAVYSRGEQVAVYEDGVRIPSPTEPGVLTASRPFLERLIRRRVQGLPGIELLRGRVQGFELEAGAVVGVRIEGASTGAHARLAGLVVDATGRGSRVGTWLSDAGWSSPRAERVHSGVNYATAIFQRERGKPEVGAGIARYTTISGPDGIHSASVTAIEGDRWMVMLSGRDDHRPARTEQEFRAISRRLPDPFE